MEEICTRNGERESFDQRKLYASIYHPAKEAGHSDEEAEELADDLVEQVMDWLEDNDQDVVTTKDLEDQVLDRLEEQDEDVAFLYRTHLDIN